MLYIAGFILCFAAGQVVKAIVYEQIIVDNNDYFYGHVTRNLFDQMLHHLGRVYSPENRDIHGMNPDNFWALSLIDPKVGRVFTALSTLALLTAWFFAVVRAQRGRTLLLWNVLWITGVMILACMHFMLPNDLVFRSARFMFVPIALCWSCFILASLENKIFRRIISIASGRSLCGVALCSAVGLVVFAAAFYWHNLPIKVVSLQEVYRKFASSAPAIRSYFDVYLDDNRLLYVRERCTDIDAVAKFFLHVVPVDRGYVSASRRPYGFDNFDFHLRDYGYRDDGRCLAARNLPDYPIAEIRTGQFTGEGRIWDARMRFAAE